ncbi:hypothetical protein ACTXT7_010535 [Hymenolepis weldensis]
MGKKPTKFKAAVVGVGVKEDLGDEIKSLPSVFRSLAALGLNGRRAESSVGTIKHRSADVGTTDPLSRLEPNYWFLTGVEATTSLFCSQTAHQPITPATTSVFTVVSHTITTPLPPFVLSTTRRTKR